jgi:hypothetical protein
MVDEMSGQTTGTPQEPGGAPGGATATSTMYAPPAPPVPPAPPGTATPPPGAPYPRERGWRKGGAVFGSVLVLVGLFALFGGFTSVFDVFRLWPLLIIFGGLIGILSPRDDAIVKRIAEGLGAVAFGLVLLGNTFGYLPWTVWFTLASLWPVLLVALGIELVGRGLHMDWLRAMSNVVVILALAYGVFVLQPVSGRAIFPFPVLSAPTATFADSKPHDAAVTDGSATIRVGATRLNVSAGDTLASISGRSPFSLTPKLTTSVTSSTAAVSVDEPGQRTVFIGTEDSALNVTLDRAVKWSELRFDVGAVAADADLSGLDVSNVQVNVGASDARFKIGSLARDVRVDISGGATSVTVLIPASAACTINSTSGLSNVRVPPSFRQTSGIVVVGNSTFVADGSGGPKIAISLNSGVSDLRVETY